MDYALALELDEKIATLQGTIRQIKDENLMLQAKVDLLEKEKEILLNALNDFTEMEISMDETRTRNAQLESQLASLANAVEELKSN